MAQQKLFSLAIAILLFFATVASATLPAAEIQQYDAFDAQTSLEAHIEVLKHMNVWLRNKEVSTFFRSMLMKTMRSDYLATNRAMVNEFVSAAFRLNALPQVMQAIVVGASLDHQKVSYVDHRDLTTWMKSVSLKVFSLDVAQHARAYDVMRPILASVDSVQALLENVEIYQRARTRTIAYLKLSGEQRIDPTIYSQAEVDEDIATDAMRDHFLSDLTAAPSVRRLPYPYRSTLRVKRDIAELTIRITHYGKILWDAKATRQEKYKSCSYGFAFSLFGDNQLPPMSELFPLPSPGFTSDDQALHAIIRTLIQEVDDATFHFQRKLSDVEHIRSAIILASRAYQERQLVDGNAGSTSRIDSSLMTENLIDL